MDWHAWIGLPHEFGADPRHGKAADCLVMVWAILDDAGIPHPEFQYEWLELARSAEWDILELIWHQITEPLNRPEPYAVCLFENGPAGLGVGIVIDDGVLIVHHKRGVRWVPLKAMRKLEYCCFR